MVRQYSTTVRDGKRQSQEASVGASPKLVLLTGTQPADCATAETGTRLVVMDLPADWLTHDGSGTSTKLGTWQSTGIDAGNAGYYRFYNNAETVCHEQGSIGQPAPLLTNAPTAAGDNVLNFADASAVAVGNLVVGAGIEPNTYVLATTASTVTLSCATVSGVASSAAITFSGDMVIDNTSIAIGQQVTVTTYTVVEGYQ